MPTIDLNLNGDNAWPDIASKDVVHLPDAVWHVAALEGGMTSGKVSLALRLDLPDGTTLVAETSLAAWIAATSTLRGRFPQAFVGTPLAEHS
jgi:hypothetical protein